MLIVHTQDTLLSIFSLRDVPPKTYIQNLLI